jgi:hypothetical protein
LFDGEWRGFCRGCRHIRVTVPSDSKSRCGIFIFFLHNKKIEREMGKEMPALVNIDFELARWVFYSTKSGNTGLWG